MALGTTQKNSSQPLPYSEEIQKLRMFHAQLKSRKAAEEYVKKNSKGPGSFIVRPNSSQDPSFVSITISLADARMCHVKVYIEICDGKYLYYMSKENKFDRFANLLEYFKKHRIHCLENLENVRLIFPLEIYDTLSFKREIQLLPPAPLPQSKTTDLNPYYSHVDPNKNYFEEVYKLLKESELCHCGISLEDSQLPLDWQMHWSDDPETYKKIFYQHEGFTTWEIPSEIIPLLSLRQVGVITYLYQKGKHPVPDCLTKCLKDLKDKEERQEDP